MPCPAPIIPRQRRETELMAEDIAEAPPSSMRIRDDSTCNTWHIQRWQRHPERKATVGDEELTNLTF